MKHLHVLGFVALVAATPAIALQVVDQENLIGLIDFNTQSSGVEWQQTIVTGTSGRLDGVELWTRNAPGSFSVSIYRGAAWQSGMPAFSVLASPEPSSSFTVDLSAAQLRFFAGDALTLAVTSLGLSEECCGLWGTAQNRYAHGDLYFNGQRVDLMGGFDLAFRTYVTPVPETSTALSMTLGLMAFVLRRTRTIVGRARVRRKLPS